MGKIRPILASDLDSLIMAQIKRLNADIPGYLAHHHSVHNNGVTIDSLTRRFSLHGTTIASFYIKGGKEVLTVSDGKVSEGSTLHAASLEFNKLVVIDQKNIMSLSGSVGFGMKYAKMLKNWVETTERIREERLSTRAKVNMLSSILRESLPLAMSGIIVVPILSSYDDKHGPRIFYFTPDGSVVSKTTYAISGSGRVNEGGLLQQWRMDMSREEGVELAKNLVKNAHVLDSGTGGKIFIKILSKSGIDSVDGGHIND